jgi:hypothetical protein
MESNQIHVTVHTADAGPAGWIAYSIATWIAWASLCGFVSGKANIYMACISLACTIPYLFAASTQLKMGNGAGGITWLYFGSFFAFCSALTYAVSYFGVIYEWETDSRILAFQWAVLAIVLISTTPIFLKFAPAAASISIIAADTGLVTLTLIYSGFVNSFILQLSGWCFFIAGFFGICMTIGGILENAGMKFPMGKPLMAVKSD